MHQKLKISYTFTPEFGLKIGSGQGKDGMIDNAFRTRRNADGKIVLSIPATSVKGRIRASYQRYLHVFHKAADYESLLFGKSGHEGCLKFSDLTLQEGNGHLGIHTSTTIDRFRKTAKNKTLRIEEFLRLDNNARLYGEIEGYIPCNKSSNELPLEIAFLILALKSTEYVGGDKSTGWGKGKIQLEKVTLGPNSISNILDDVENIVRREEKVS